MVVVGYHTIAGDGSTAVGQRTQSLGIVSTGVGIRSTITDDNVYGSVYGIDNKLSYETTNENAPGGSIVNGAFGMLNKVDSSLTSMVFGTGNRITNAFGNVNEALKADSSPVVGAKYISILLMILAIQIISLKSWVIFRRSTAAPYLHLGTATYQIMQDAPLSLGLGIL